MGVVGIFFWGTQVMERWTVMCHLRGTWATLENPICLRGRILFTGWGSAMWALPDLVFLLLTSSLPVSHTPLTRVRHTNRFRIGPTPDYEYVLQRRFFLFIYYFSYLSCPMCIWNINIPRRFSWSTFWRWFLFWSSWRWFLFKLEHSCYCFCLFCASFVPYFFWSECIFRSLKLYFEN